MCRNVAYSGFATVRVQSGTKKAGPRLRLSALKIRNIGDRAL